MVRIMENMSKNLDAAVEIADKFIKYDRQFEAIDRSFVGIQDCFDKVSDDMKLNYDNIKVVKKLTDALDSRVGRLEFVVFGAILYSGYKFLKKKKDEKMAEKGEK